MGFLKSVAPAPYSGILLTLSSSVYRRLLLHADLPGSSKEAVVPHLHAPYAMLRHSPEMNLREHRKFSSVAEREKALSSLFLELEVE